MWTDFDSVMAYVNRESDPERIRQFREFAMANAAEPPHVVTIGIREAARICLEEQIPVATGLLLYMHIPDNGLGMPTEPEEISARLGVYTSICSLPFSLGAELDAAIVEGCAELHESEEFSAGYPMLLVFAMPTPSQAGSGPITQVELFAVHTISGGVFSTRYDASKLDGGLQFTQLNGHAAGEVFLTAAQAAAGTLSRDQRNYKEQIALFEKMAARDEHEH